ncbi:PQQ-binding-like beta-propeller repeat protein [Pseudomonas qingdaonensis]|nr:PQQ-binding-like beta-propeller repeat protein [Pseudomonas qingdaonensis]
MVDGVMYTTGPFSVVYALDARDGRLIWKYDPQSDRHRAGEACCDAVNRGVAVWKGKVYVGVLDGRLEAIDAKTGQRAWSVDTRADHKRSYTITGAPRVVNGKVVIGNGGAEFGVRGYVTAYDAETGKEAWRFYTVPGDPKLPPEGKGMEIAAKTWFGDAYVEQGGGGTAWDSFAYDPELNLLYIGVGNGSLWDPKWRSQAKGDNLFLSSIVAVNADTGEYVALPDHPGRCLGLHRHPAHDPGRAAHRRQAAQGADAGAEKRLLLCDRPRHRRAAVGQGHRAAELDQGHGHEDRAADPGRRERRLLEERQAQPGDPGVLGCA